MERYINSFATENDIQIALQNGELFKPYVAYIEDVDRIDWNSKTKIVDYTTEYLTFNILSAGTINWTANSTAFTKTIDYKVNNGEWVSITSNTGSSAPTITVNSGDKVQFKGNNTQYGNRHILDLYSNSFGGSALFEVEGNIMSLIYGDDFKNNSTINGYAFYNLFSNCANLVSAENLILPATTLAQDCYYRMFYGCTSLTTAPALPATTLAEGCYLDMFSYCTNLTTAPKELPATTLAQECYRFMFSNCTSLTTAPELPANRLVRDCYVRMFSDCRKLNYIKCLATEIESNATGSWVDGVASTGTFVKNPNMTSWATGSSGIPNGWTVQDA